MTEHEARVMQLARLLASYEMDAPHNNAPGFDVGSEESQHYPDIPLQTFLEWLEEPHCGDCIKLPAPCIRCYADACEHKARWLVQRMEG